jgi:hypothetical protein
MARLKPCPSFDGPFPSLLGSVEASGAVQSGQLKNLVWTGLAELSPGRESWVGFERTAQSRRDG